MPFGTMLQLLAGRIGRRLLSLSLAWLLVRWMSWVEGGCSERILLKDVSVCEYTQYRLMSKARSRPFDRKLEGEIVKRTAQEMTRLNRRNMEDGVRLREVGRAVRTLVHLRSGLCLWLDPTASADDRIRWATAAQAAVEECVTLDPESASWKEVCYDSFAVGAALVDVSAHLPNDKGQMWEWLLAATRVGNVPFVRKLCSTHSSMILQGTRYFEVLRGACQGGSVQMFRFLQRRRSTEGLSAEAVQTTNKQLLASALSMAAEYGHLELVRYLVERAAKDLLRRDPTQYVAQLHTVAYANGHEHVAAFIASRFPKLINVEQSCIAAAASGNLPLLRKHMGVEGGDVGLDRKRLHFSSKFFEDVLVMAAGSGHLPTVQFLLQRAPDGSHLLWPVDPTARKNEALGLAALKGHSHILQELFKRHPSITLSLGGSRILANAALGGHLSILQYLVGPATRAVDLGGDNNRIIRKACQGGHLAIVQFLLRGKHSGDPRFARVDPAAKDNACLIRASQFGHLPLVRYLMEECGTAQGIAPGSRHNEAVIRAAGNGHLPVVRYLLTLTATGELRFPDVDPAAQDNEALIRAITNGHVSVVQLLLATRPEGSFYFSRVDPAARKNLPLTKALLSRNASLIQFMLRRGPDGRLLLPGVAITMDVIAAATQLGDMAVLQLVIALASPEALLMTDQEKAMKTWNERRVLSTNDARVREGILADNAALQAIVQQRKRILMNRICQAFVGSAPPPGVFRELQRNVATAKSLSLLARETWRWPVLLGWLQTVQRQVQLVLISILIGVIASYSWTDELANLALGSVSFFSGLLPYVDPYWLQFQTLAEPYWTSVYAFAVANNLQFLGQLGMPALGVLQYGWMALMVGWSWFHWAVHTNNLFLATTIQLQKFQYARMAVVWAMHQAARGGGWCLSWVYPWRRRS